MYKFLLILGMVLSCNLLWSQNVSTNLQLISSGDQMAAMGTFYFEAQKPKEGYEIFQLEQLDQLRYEIEMRRSDVEVIRWLLTDYTVVIILPRNQINAPTFEPITELYQ